LPDRGLLDVFTLTTAPGTHAMRRQVAAMRSTDGGVTWSSPLIVADLRAVATTDPESGAPVNQGSAQLTAVVVDRVQGRVYVVWQDARFNGGAADGIALSSSDDGGRTWTPVVQVNRTPARNPVADRQAFAPSVAVAADHSIAVGYFDFRNNDEAASLSTDRWLAVCRAVARSGCTTTDAINIEIRLTDRSFDARLATRLSGFGPPGYFLGNYQGLSSAGAGFLAVFTRTLDNQPPSVVDRWVLPA
jgi:hypothetical protein